MSRGLQLYKSYSFREKDPIIDRMRTLVDEEADSMAQVSRDSGVSTATFRAWFRGTTRRPQYCTIAATARSLGFDFALVRSNQPFSNGKGKATEPDIIARRPGAKRRRY
jgi:DNA-binding phage protein